MSYDRKNCSLLLILLKLLLILLLFLDSAGPAASSSCQPDCGGIQIPSPFGIGGNGCYLEESYKIECRNTSSTQSAPFLSVIGKEVVSFSLPKKTGYFGSLLFGAVRIRSAIASAGCSSDGKESAESLLNLTGTPFFIDSLTSLIAVGCNSKASFTYVKPNTLGCESNCSVIKGPSSNSIPFFNVTGCLGNVLSYYNDEVCTEDNPEVTKCDGSKCCQASLPLEPQQVIGIRIESNDGNSTSREHCRVAFLTDDVYTLSNMTEAEKLFAKGYASVSLQWVIQTNNRSFLNSLGCINKKDYEIINSYSDARKVKCICERSSISEISYGNCGCNYGYTGNPYTPGGCVDIDECKSGFIICQGRDTCENTEGGYHCSGDKTKAIVIGVGAGFGVLVLISVLWWLRKFVMKRRMRKRKKKFFKRNGGLLLQQELSTRESSVEKTRIFSSRELEKATENFSENRVLGRGGQGTVYKGMLVDGRTVAVKKSKVIDEDKLQEFINEVVILSQINHRHIVKLLGCCLETEVPILVYEFILNGNLFQHIHEESDDYTMVWGMRLRIAVDIAGALAYLHSSASSPIYHRDIKSTNILLDEKYRAKVSDFGTSRSITIDQTHWTTVISGTVGYVDPEYYRSSQFTEKSDVYSFGVVLAELITGDKPVIAIQNTRGVISLAEHFRVAMKEKRCVDIMDSRIRDDCKPEQVMAMANLAMKCLSSKGKNRPSMREVFTELEKISTSPEDSQLQTMVDEEDEDEEEVIEIISRDDSWSLGVTAPAPKTMPSSSSCSDVEPLFPRSTW